MKLTSKCFNDLGMVDMSSEVRFWYDAILMSVLYAGWGNSQGGYRRVAQVREGELLIVNQNDRRGVSDLQLL